MNFSYDSANSAKMYEVMAKAENLQREMKLQKRYINIKYGK